LSVYAKKLLVITFGCAFYKILKSSFDFSETKFSAFYEQLLSLVSIFILLLWLVNIFYQGRHVMGSLLEQWKIPWIVR